MARIRSVKPEFFTHPEVLACSIPARLLLVALFGQADDEGRLYDQPRKIAGNSFGDDDDVDVDNLLTELADRGRIRRYRSSERACIQVLNFSRHQSIPPTKFKSSTIPAPQADTEQTEVSAEVDTALPDVSVHTPPVDSGNGSGMEVEVEPGPGTEPIAAAPTSNGKGKGKDGAPFHLADAVNLGLVVSLRDRYRRRGWEKAITEGLLTGLIFGSESKKLPACGPKAVNAAIDDLYEHAAGVKDPAGYLKDRAVAYASEGG